MNTSQLSELDRVKLKIKALAAKTVDRGATEEEALAAMNVVGRLLTQYNLTMNELDVRDATYRTIHIKVDRSIRHPIDHAVPAMAAFTGTKTWFHKRWGQSSSYAFFGQEQDLSMAEYLFNLIMAAMDHEADEYKRTDEYRSRSYAGDKRSAYVSFQRGMSSRIAYRLMQMKKENDAALREHSTSTALVALKDQLTEDAFNKEGLKLRSARRSYRIGDYGAFGAGQQAGNRVNLSRPLKDSSLIKGHLK